MELVLVDTGKCSSNEVAVVTFVSTFLTLVLSTCVGLVDFATTLSRKWKDWNTFFVDFWDVYMMVINVEMLHDGSYPGVIF